MAVRLSASRPGRPLVLKRFLVLISVRGSVDPRAMLRLQELHHSKKSNDLIGNRTRDLPACNFSLIDIVGGGVQLGPLGTAATNRPIVPAPGDYDDGEIGGMIGRVNRSTLRKPAPVPLCPP
jgi:hypothetical protein